jgi:hypothetical protein
LRDLQKDVLSKKEFNMNGPEQGITFHPLSYCDDSSIDRKDFRKHKENLILNWKIPELNAGV